MTATNMIHKNDILGYIISSIPVHKGSHYATISLSNIIIIIIIVNYYIIYNRAGNQLRFWNLIIDNRLKSVEVAN